MRSIEMLLIVLSIGVITPPSYRQTPLQIGVVFHLDPQTSAVNALVKEIATVKAKRKALGFGGAVTTGEIKGPAAAIRLTAGQSHSFIVCGVDPTRYKLYKLEATKDKRQLKMFESGSFASAESKMQDSEIEVIIKPAETGCYNIAPTESLDRGEYAFSPVDSNDVFAFGVGSKKN